ncbi:hypothetical protein Acr_28g0010030 [Actinidia rufa]|uniref:Uncharacterized protein n=1 Tax=Actinidia rufa TaxID=165716 RepID=A0A7J0HBA1_9ERIC|nr:hypothetical protein Acr_28g0010030 [Actinidia rufa]
MAAAKTDDDAVDKGSNSEIGSSKMKGKAKADHNDGEVDEETNILRSLFDGQGIHSAMNHDVIMNAHDKEKIRLEEQASQVAQRAAEALRQSGMLRSRKSIPVPTWIGKSISRKFGSTVNSQLTNNSKTGKHHPAVEQLCQMTFQLVHLPVKHYLQPNYWHGYEGSKNEQSVMGSKISLVWIRGPLPG